MTATFGSETRPSPSQELHSAPSSKSLSSMPFLSQSDRYRRTATGPDHNRPVRPLTGVEDRLEVVAPDAGEDGKQS